MVIRPLPSFSPNGGMNTGNPLDIATSIYFVWLTGLAGPALALAMVGNVFKSVREGPGIHDII
jgi:hypothetical protein